ncbi:MAG: hypothetical protein MZV63_64790 [Marinilabiliales bacterium]|nr:hypothetical protein [Marinilabiliales bacterium]
MYLPEEKQLTRSPVRRGDPASPTSSACSSGSMSFEEAYAVEDSPFPTDAARVRQVKLTPRTEGDYLLHPPRDRRGHLAPPPGPFPRVGREQARIRLQPGPDRGPHPRPDLHPEGPPGHRGHRRHGERHPPGAEPSGRGSV